MSQSEPPTETDDGPGPGAYLVIAGFALLLVLFVVLAVQTGNMRLWGAWNPHNNL